MTTRTPQSAAVVHKAARAALASTGAVFPPHTRGPGLRDALAACGYGLDLLDGEHVVAWLAHDDDAQQPAHVIVTDRALLTCNGAEVTHTPLAQIDAAAAHDGWLQSSLRLTLSGDQPAEVSLLRDVAPLARLLTALAQAAYAPQPRRAPLLTVSEADPAGIKQLTAALQEPGPQVQALLRALAEGERPLKAAQEAAVRVALLHRALQYGRPAAQGRWLSPLPRPALAAALVACRPGKHRLDQGRAATTFELNPRESSLIPDREQLQDALLSSVADRITRRAIGVELSDLLDEEVTSLRVTLTDAIPCDDLIDGLTADADAPTSAWARLRGAAASLLGQAADRPHLTAFTVEGWLGGRYTDLAMRRPLLLRDLSRDLLPYEHELF